jgi:hypothetical protein
MGVDTRRNSEEIRGLANHLESSTPAGLAETQ